MDVEITITKIPGLLAQVASFKMINGLSSGKISSNQLDPLSALMSLKYPKIRIFSRLSRLPIFPYPVFSSQSAGSVDPVEIVLASHRATLHGFVALIYGPARALEQDRWRGFRAWVDCGDSYGRFLFGAL
jgi:hypothetical protein